MVVACSAHKAGLQIWGGLRDDYAADEEVRQLEVGLRVAKGPTTEAQIDDDVEPVSWVVKRALENGREVPGLANPSPASLPRAKRPSRRVAKLQIWRPSTAKASRRAPLSLVQEKRRTWSSCPHS